MILLNNVTKEFTTDQVITKALNGVSLEISNGDFVSIMGPSGCGKSTLLNILGMVDSATSGQVIFKDKDLSQLSRRQRAKLRKEHIGFVFQSFNLVDDLTVYENIELPLIYANEPRSKRKARVDEMLQRLQIAHRAEHFPQQLSGGQQQRVAIARAMANHPDVILADEPTGNLDSENGKQVMQWLSELNAEGVTVVMVTHSEEDARYAKTVLRMIDGKILSNTKG